MNVLYNYDPDTTVGEVPSPCVSVCKMDANKEWCTGCFRSIEEIKRWSSSSNEAKRVVWREIKHRMFDQA